MSETLLPCPFCGGEADAGTVLPGGSRIYGCFDCGIRAHTAEDWNRRTPGPATAKMLEVLATELVEAEGSHAAGLPPGAGYGIVVHLMVDDIRELLVEWEPKGE